VEEQDQTAEQKTVLELTEVK